MIRDLDDATPVCLTVPGLGSSGPGHWQTIWERERPDCHRIELGGWDRPHRNSWISKIEQAVIASDAPVILVAHSLGCVAVAWWASFLGEAVASKVRGALLVAPADVDRSDACPAIASFGPSPDAPFAFPSILVASRDDPYATIDRSRALAAKWLCDFVDIGEAGHINADSGLGAWADGQRLLELLVDESPEISHWLPPALTRDRAASRDSIG